MNFIEILKLVFSLLPILHDAVAAVEALFPQGGNGQKKLDMVRAILEQAMSASGAASSTFSIVWPVLSTTIGSIVAIKKAVSSTVSAPAPTVLAPPPTTTAPTAPTAQSAAPFTIPASTTLAASSDA